MEEAWAAWAEEGTRTLQHGGDLGALLPSSAAVARSPGYISSSLSAQYNTPVTAVRRATCLCLLGHTTNSRSLALIELMFLFRGSCLVSLSLRFTLATSLSSHNLYSRLPRSDQLLVSSLSYIWYRSITTAQEYTGSEIKKESMRKVKLWEALQNSVVWCYLAVLGGASLQAVLDISWDDWCWETSPFRYHIPILFISLWKKEEETYRVFK